MSKIDDLISKLCPNGVEYKKLGNVCDVVVGFSFKANLFKKEGLPIVKTTNIQDGYIDENNMVFFDKSDYSNNLENYIIYPNDIVLGMSGTIKVGINNTNKNYYLNQRVCKFKPHKELNNKFLYYILSNSINELFDVTSGSSVKNLSNENIKSLQIAVPPIEVQCEIVHILDDFTLLSAELSAELKARQQQYEYYKNNLLSINGIEYKLGDVADFKTGTKPTEILNIGEYEYINAGTTNSGYTGKTNFDGDKVTTPSRGQGGIGFVGYQKNDFWLGPLCYAIWSKDENILLNKYLYYELSSKKDEILKRKNTGGVPALNGCDLKTIPINIPKIDEQIKIINILDKFEKICEDISEGLPAEIEARKKQYEYYRDKLLTFKELEVNEEQ